MLRLFFAFIVGFILAGCSYLHPYRPNIQQGNVISANRVSQLQLGMSQTQVISIMGTPVLQNTFANNRLVYVYQLLPNHGTNVEKIVTLTFSNGRLVNIQKQI